MPYPAQGPLHTVNFLPGLLLEGRQSSAQDSNFLGLLLLKGP